MNKPVAYIGNTYQFSFAGGELPEDGELLGVVSHAQGFDFHVGRQHGAIVRKQKILLDGVWYFPEGVVLKQAKVVDRQLDKPTVRIGDRYEFSCDGENTAMGTLAGTYEDKINSLRFEGNSYWMMIRIGDKWLSAHDVVVVKADEPATKPVVHAFMEYEFSNAQGTWGVVGILEHVDRSMYFVVRDQGYWERILVNGKWMLVSEVEFRDKPQTRRLLRKKELRKNEILEAMGITNEDSESVRSAETIQSLREENANMLRHIRKLELTIDIYETAFVVTKAFDVLEAAQSQVRVSWDRKTEGAK